VTQVLGIIQSREIGLTKRAIANTNNVE